MSRRCIGDIADDLCHAFVVKPHRDATRLQKDGYAVANNHRLRMIDLKSVTAREFHRERLEWRSTIKCDEELIKMLRSHTKIIAESRPLASRKCGRQVLA